MSTDGTFVCHTGTRNYNIKNNDFILEFMCTIIGEIYRLAGKLELITSRKSLHVYQTESERESKWP